MSTQDARVRRKLLRRSGLLGLTRGESAKVFSEAASAVSWRDHVVRAHGRAELQKVVEPPVEERHGLNQGAHEAPREARQLRPPAQRFEGEQRDLPANS